MFDGKLALKPDQLHPEIPVTNSDINSIFDGVTWLRDTTQTPSATPMPETTTPIPALKQNLNTIWQKVHLKAGQYVLSWQDQARKIDGSPLIDPNAPVSPMPYRVTVVSADGTSALTVNPTPFLPTATTALEYNAQWGDRHQEVFTISTEQDYYVMVGASPAVGTTLGSVLIRQMQLESTESGKATNYQDVVDNRHIASGVCPKATATDMQKAFKHVCTDTDGCFYELNEPIVLRSSGIDGQGPNQGTNLPGKLATGNFNYRHVDLALNLAGTGLSDCTKDQTLSCYGSGFFEYTLQHDAFTSNVLGFDGKTEAFNFGSASINHGKALAAERYITLPLSSADSALLAQPSFNKVELRGRPLDGSYVLRIWDRPGLVWSHLEDVQLVLRYRYWSAIKAEQLARRHGAGSSAARPSRLELVEGWPLQGADLLPMRPLCVRRIIVTTRNWCWAFGFLLACSSKDHSLLGPSSDSLDGTEGGAAGAAGGAGASASGGASGSGAAGGSAGAAGGGGAGTGGGMASNGGTAGSGGAGAGGASSQGGSGGVDLGICGDGFRIAGSEECDDGNTSSSDACSECHVRDLLAAGATTFASPLPLGRRLGEGRHPLAGQADGFAVSLLDDSTDPPHVSLARFSPVGVSLGPTLTLDDHALEDADPVVAQLPGGESVVVWTAPDDDERGVWMRRVAADGSLAAPRRVTTLEDFGQFAPDVLWDGSQLVVAWVDDGDLTTGQDLYLATFSADLTPQGEQVLAGTTATESNVALAAFAGSWAAAWRADADGLETIAVRAGSRSWSLGPFVPGASSDPPALAAVDATHLALVFAEGVSEEGSSAPPTNRLRVVVLDTASPGAVDLTTTSVLAAVDTNGLLAPSHPALVSVQGALWASWRTEATPGQALAEELWLQPLAWSAMTGLDLSAPVVPLPRQTGHQPGDQRRPALAAVGSSLAVAWEDLGRTFAPLGANHEVVVELAPLPLLRLDEVTP